MEQNIDQVYDLVKNNLFSLDKVDVESETFLKILQDKRADLKILCFFLDSGYEVENPLSKKNSMTLLDWSFAKKKFDFAIELIKRGASIHSSSLLSMESPMELSLLNEHFDLICLIFSSYKKEIDTIYDQLENLSKNMTIDLWKSTYLPLRPKHLEKIKEIINFLDKNDSEYFGSLEISKVKLEKICEHDKNSK